MNCTYCKFKIGDQVIWNGKETHHNYKFYNSYPDYRGKVYTISNINHMTRGWENEEICWATIFGYRGWVCRELKLYKKKKLKIQLPGD